MARRSSTRLAGLLATLLGGAACGHEPPQLLRTLEPGEVSTAQAGIRAELTQVTYGKRVTAVTVRMHNETRKTVVVEPHAATLEIDALHYVPRPGSSRPSNRRVGPGDTINVMLEYDLGRRLRGPATLTLRDLRADGHAAKPLSLPIPSAPVDPGSDQSGTGP